MAYDEKLADRVREVLEGEPGIAGVRPKDFTGRPIKGMVYVGPRGYGRAPSLKTWVEQGMSYARSLPRKG